MTIILFFVFCLVLYCSVIARTVFQHPLLTSGYTIKDFYKWIRGKQWRVCKAGGQLICFVGLFGRGKTLSAVHYVRSVYKKYNDREIYDFKRGKTVTQKVKIISNVDLLDVPYEKFISLAQLVQFADDIRDIDDQNDTSTVCLVLGDEFSVQLNSRSFKSNIDPLFLNTLLTCRHHGGGMSLIYTAQRFSHVDALLRQVTSVVIDCNKIWRFMCHAEFDAFELENATSTQLVHSKARYGWFIRDSDYRAYDTLACVGNLAKSCKAGDMLSEAEILALQCNQGAQMDAVLKPSRKFIRSQKRRK